MLDIPESERNCRSLLMEGNLRPSRLWRWSTWSRPRVPYPSVDDFPTYIFIRMSFEILKYNLRLFSPLTDVGRHFAATSMASAQINVPDHAEALRIYKEDAAKKRAAAKKKPAAGKSKEGASTAMEVELVSSPERSPSRKRQRKASAVDKQKKVASEPKKKSASGTLEAGSSTMLVDSGLSAFSAPAKFLEKAGSLMLPADEDHLKSLRTEDVFDTVLLANFQVKLSCFVSY
jgi:hypothetical protein